MIKSTFEEWKAEVESETVPASRQKPQNIFLTWTTDSTTPEGTTPIDMSHKVLLEEKSHQPAA